MIKLLIFDGGYLLYDHSKKEDDKLIKFLRKNGVNSYKSVDHCLARRGSADKQWEDLLNRTEHGLISLYLAHKIELESVGIRDQRIIKKWQLINRASEYKRKLVPNRKLTLKKLKNLGYKLSILTDASRNSTSIEKTLSFIGLKNLFNSVFSSHDTGHMKPEKEAYFTVLKHFKLRPSETIFVGHSKDEIEGARKHGIRTIAVDWDKGTKSDFYAKNFNEIPKILEKINE